MHKSHMVGALLSLVFLADGVAVAQGGFRPDMAPVSTYKAVSFSMPLVTMTRERVARLEFNLSGQGSIALEGSVKNRREEVGEEEQMETGESLMAEGYGAALLISRYSSGANMSGFYWTLGGGMREERINWQVEAEEKDPQADLRLVDDKNRFEHEVVAKGATGHLRIGYRYVADSIPIAAGIYLGARHFQAGVEDAETKDDPKYDQTKPDPMTNLEKERLKRRIATAPEAGVEFGFSF
jgi:hypothetical protein